MKFKCSFVSLLLNKSGVQESISIHFEYVYPIKIYGFLIHQTFINSYYYLLARHCWVLGTQR